MAEKGFVQRAKDLIWWGGHSENSVKSQQDVNSKNKPVRKDTRTTGQTPSQGSPLSPQVGQPKRRPGSVHNTAAVPMAQANAVTRTPQYSLSYDQVTVDYQTQLGMGSFGRVYKGVYQGKPCAVKIFNKEVDIEKEVEVISRIHHKYIVRVYGWWKGEGGDGKAALVMELCSTNLKSYLDNEKMQNTTPTLQVKLTILHQITSAMIYLHSQNIVHGDLSAANVLLQIEWSSQTSQVLTAKVADFGQSRVLNPEVLKRLTTTQGNSDVMPPEVLNQGKHELTILVDVFSFGCLIAYVVSCVYPAPDHIRGSEFERRQKYLSGISETQSRIFLPLMKKCLDNNPYSRGTFEDVAKILAPSLNKYCSEGVSETEEEKTREIERLKSKIEKQSRIYEQLKTEKAVIEAAQVKVEEKAASLQEKVNTLQGELDDYKSGNSQLRKDNAEMEDLKKELQVLKQVHVGEVFVKYQELNEEKKKADLQNEQLVASKIKLQRECKHLEEAVNTLKGELQTKKGELGTTTQMRDELTQSLTATSTTLKDTRNQCAGLQGEVDKLNGECGKLRTERDRLKEDLTSSQNKEKLTKEQLKRSKEDYTSAQKKVVSLEAEVKSLNEKLHKKTTSFSSVNKDKNMWMKKYDDEARRSENLKREVGKTNEEVVDLKDKNKQLQSDLKSASNERDKFERETERLKEDVFRTGKERDRLQSRLENKLEDLKEKEEEIRHLKNDVEELAKQTTEGKGELDDKATENESLKKELEEKKAEYDRVQGLYVAANKEKEARGQQIKERDEQLTEKQSDLESKQEHIDNLKKKMSAEEESYARLLNECYQLKETKQILEDELKEAKQKLKDELKNVQREFTASLESREKLENIRRNNAITYKDQCNRIQALADAVDASKMLNKAAEQFLAEECDVHQAMKVDLIHAHKELRLAKKCLQDYHKRMWDFVGKSRNLEHVNEELEEYKAEMERQQTVLRDLAAEKAVKVT
jgi:serine/threonine protein kinase